MSKRILIVLGAPNSPTGVLGAVAKVRLDTCIETYITGDMILCTGGWGEHFNKAPEPHAFYARNYLITKGILHNCFLDFVLSSNTVEDAVKIKAVISKFPDAELCIITSDFHRARVQLIFEEILKGRQIDYIEAKSNLSSSALKEAIKHESCAIQQIKENGLYY